MHNKCTVTEEQLKKLFEENNAVLIERFDRRFSEQDAKLEKRLSEQDARFKERLEENNAVLIERFDRRFSEQDARFKERLEENNAVLFGQLSRYFDERFNEIEGKTNQRLNALSINIDGIVKRITDDEQERAAIVYEQNRHTRWITQLARATKTKLQPE
jgi:ABC-type Zn uptake system ZnuABC Zn-binding protein ZnuA